MTSFEIFSPDRQPEIRNGVLRLGRSKSIVSRYAGHETRQVFNLHTQAMEEVGLGLKHAATEEEIWHKMGWMRPDDVSSFAPSTSTMDYS